MEISPSSSFLPLLLTLTPLPRQPRYIGGGTVLTLKSNYLSFTCLSSPTSDNTFPVKGEIIIFPRIKNQTWGRRQPLSQYAARHMGLRDCHCPRSALLAVRSATVKSDSLNSVCVATAGKRLGRRGGRDGFSHSDG